MGPDGQVYWAKTALTGPAAERGDWNSVILDASRNIYVSGFPNGDTTDVYTYGDGVTTQGPGCLLKYGD